jgi:glucokinase
VGSGGLLCALDIGGSYVRVMLTAGEEIVRHQQSSWPDNLAPRDEVKFVADLALALLAPAPPPAAVGVSLAALLDEQGVVVQWPNRPGWRGLAVKQILEARLDAPVTIEDDANAAALGEHRFGAGRGYRDLLVIMAGTGIGAGLILDGVLVRGRHGWAGELGHLILLPDGPACSCGRNGCLQALASGRALDRAAAERGLAGAPAVNQAAARGERWASEVVAACASWLGLAAANVATLLDLELVVVGGGLRALGSAWWTTMESSLHANGLNSDHHRVELRPTQLDDRAGLLGAGILAAESIGADMIEPLFHR